MEPLWLPRTVHLVRQRGSVTSKHWMSYLTALSGKQHLKAIRAAGSAATGLREVMGRAGLWAPVYRPLSHIFIHTTTCASPVNVPTVEMMRWGSGEETTCQSYKKKKRKKEKGRDSTETQTFPPSLDLPIIPHCLPIRNVIQKYITPLGHPRGLLI